MESSSAAIDMYSRGAGYQLSNCLQVIIAQGVGELQSHNAFCMESDLFGERCNA
jgi:hypothetical protein